MRKICAVLLVAFFLGYIGVGQAYADEVEGISAKAALVMDADTGTVLWEREGFKELPPASCTKILTALLALDIADEARIVRVSEQAAAVGESNVGLISGEEFALGELLDAALLKSANDACYAIGEGVAGNEPLFVRLMNLKADILGAGGANLLNTNGLPSEGHTMSCYDLAILARSAMQNPAFSERVASRYGTMEGGSYNRELKNTNKLLAMSEYVTGIKTGTTNAAGACLVSSMEREGRSVIAVVLNSADRYADSLRLLNWAVDNFVNLRIVEEGAKLGAICLGGEPLPAYAEAALELTLPKDLADGIKTEFVWKSQSPYEEIGRGEMLGTLYVTYQGERPGAVRLLSTAAYQPSRLQKFQSKIEAAIKEFGDRWRK